MSEVTMVCKASTLSSRMAMRVPTVVLLAVPKVPRLDDDARRRTGRLSNLPVDDDDDDGDDNDGPVGEPELSVAVSSVVVVAVVVAGVLSLSLSVNFPEDSRVVFRTKARRALLLLLLL